jgi:alpha-mannosidase
MRLTLLRSGTTPNEEADRELHELCYSLYPHAGSWQEASTVQQAYDLNHPLLTKVEAPHSGPLPEALSLMGVDCGNVIVEVVKQAEDGDELVVRMYEAFNRRGPVEMTFDREISSIEECDLLERSLDKGPLQVDGSRVRFDIRPLEIRTFKVKF